MHEIINNPLIIIDFFLHLDKYIGNLIESYGILTYLILFFIIFMETGFVITPFLPGDSLLFAAGTFAGLGYFNVLLLFILLFIAAVVGDTVNYWIGHKIGPKVFERKSRFIKKDHLVKTQEFYKKHGGKTIILARFVPIVRTFAPFVAGVGTMDYPHFISYNVIGGFFWTAIFIFGGYFFGNIPFVKENFETVIFVIIILSVLPMFYEYGKTKVKKRLLRKFNVNKEVNK